MQKINIEQIFREGIKANASDIHLMVGMPPSFRIYGDIIYANTLPLSASDIKVFLSELVAETKIKQFEREHKLSVSNFIENIGCFRVSLYSHKGYPEISIRILPLQIPSSKELNIPSKILDLCKEPRGLILITGAAGSGKTTTLNFLIDNINEQRNCRIITVEDPIEFRHSSKKGTIIQQEIGADIESFDTAIKHILRLDPDVICIGEIRDFETAAAALTAAETGHIVIATLHTSGAVQTIDRIIDLSPPEKQSQIRGQLALSLLGVLSQLLLPIAEKRGLILASEVLIATTAVRNIIRDNKIHTLNSVIESSANYGMYTIEKSINDLYKNGLISYETMISNAKEKNFQKV